VAFVDVAPGRGFGSQRQTRSSVALLHQELRDGPPDPARRSIIEAVYRKVNGTLDGLEDKIGPGFQRCQYQSKSDAITLNGSGSMMRGKSCLTGAPCRK